MAVQIVRTQAVDRGARITIPLVDGSVITIQAVYDAIRTFEALSENMDLQVLTKSTTSGKEGLGGGDETGITMQFLNKTTLEFTARAGPAVIACKVEGGNITASIIWEGTVTTPDAGTVLIDSAATFAEWGIQTGAAIRNVDDGSTATVLAVDSETQITHTALAGGSENDWDSAESWEIDSDYPFTPTDNVHIGFAQDVSPVAVGQEDLIRRVRNLTTIAAR